MHVFGDDGVSAINFDAYRAGVPELAWIVEDSSLQRALWAAIEQSSNVQVFSPEQCQGAEWRGSEISVSLSDGRKLSSRLLVGADGARSLVRRSAGIAAAEKDYRQSAVAANFFCEKPHGNAARQWFIRGAVLALLPLPQQQVSMIWSLPADEAKRIEQLGADELCAEVAAASRSALGRLSLATAQRSYSLRRISAARLIAPRVALVGDAAHTIHPLAGQGLNLGLQDVRSLAAVLAGRSPNRDPGDPRLLRRYERERAEPILSMELMVDGLFRLFGSASGTASRLRNAGLNLAERAPVIKNLLMRHAMG